MKFNFKDYFDCCSFDLEIDPNINFNNFEYIVFSSSESQKKIFAFYKEEMQQGNPITEPNLGKPFITLTGFYDFFPKKPSWVKFKEFCPIIMYTYLIKDDTVWLTPLNIKEYNEIFKTKKDKIIEV